MTAVLFVLLAVPFLWSGGLYLLRTALRTGADIPADRDEKRYLALMLAPVVLGAGVLIAARQFEVHLALSMPLPLPMPVTGDIDGGAGAVTSGNVAAPISYVIWRALPVGLVGLYAVVALALAARLLTAYARIALTCATAAPEIALGEGVRVSARTGIALAWGRATVLLPRHLLQFLSPVQTDMIIRHERAHLNRRDPLYFAALAWIDIVFWFNPFIRAQTRQCRLAAELDCDARVTGAAPEMREVYAKTLVMALKHAAGNARQCVPAAFSPAKSGDYRMRISEIMHPQGKRSKIGVRLIAGACLLLVPIGLAQLAWSQSPASLPTALHVTAAGAAAAPARFFTVMPVAGHVSSGFGMRKNPVTGETSMHEGVDVSTPIGTPVYAPAAGHIIRADLAEPGYGKVVEIDHGDGVVTRYMHLGDFEAKVGDSVAAGQEFAKSGNTGRSTGPHVHIGLFENGTPVDPAGKIPLPPAG